jgi:hypothetical protein
MSVVDRLSKPVSPSNPDVAPLPTTDREEEQYFDERGLLDVASFMGSHSGYNTPTDRRRSSSAGAQRDRRWSQGEKGDEGGSVREETEEEKEKRRQNFQAFLGRQSQTILRRNKKTEDVSPWIIECH